MPRLGELAAQATKSEDWLDESYLMGPAVLGLTAASVNEVALHCEDLFALLKYLGEREQFTQRITTYSAGRVVAFGKTLPKLDREAIRRLFFVPSLDQLQGGLTAAEEPAASLAVAVQGMHRLVDRVQQVVQWYETYEPFHLQYKHGLKIPLSPFGRVTDETAAERQAGSSAPLFAFSNESPVELARRPIAQQVAMIPIDPAHAAHLGELAQARNLLHYRLAGPEVDLRGLVDMSFLVMQLLRYAINNRLTLMAGPDDDGAQCFYLPGPAAAATVEVLLQPSVALTLDTIE